MFNEVHAWWKYKTTKIQAPIHMKQECLNIAYLAKAYARVFWTAIRNCKTETDSAYSLTTDHIYTNVREMFGGRYPFQNNLEYPNIHINIIIILYMYKCKYAYNN